MLRSILSRFSFLRGTNHNSNEGRDSNEEDESGGFRPSRLDASVLYAHGADVERLEDEIADVEERVRTLERERRNG